MLFRCPAVPQSRSPVVPAGNFRQGLPDYGSFRYYPAGTAGLRKLQILSGRDCRATEASDTIRQGLPGYGSFRYYPAGTAGLRKLRERDPTEAS